MKAPFPFPPDTGRRLTGFAGVREVCLTEPLLPVVSGRETGYPFKDFRSMLDFAGNRDHSLGWLGLRYESSRSGMEVIETVHRVGRMMPAALCNSGKGGISVTPRAAEQKASLDRNKNS